jgi:glycosyltransferase involved in cell wall biosynthesis
MLTTAAAPVSSNVLAPAAAPTTVLHVRVVTGAGGGPDKTILNSPRFQSGSHYAVHCAYMHPPQDPGFDFIRQRAADWHAPLHRLADRGAWDVSVVRRLLSLCRLLDVKIWHAHDYKSNLLGLLLRQFHRMHLVTTVHGWVQHTRRMPLYNWIDRCCLQYYDRVICVSADLADACRNCGVSSNRCVLLENGIDVAEYTRTMPASHAKQQLGLNSGRPLVGAVGRLSPEKGFDVLIDAVTALHRTGLEVDLAIAGDGDARDDLERRIAAQPHPDRFHLLGFLQELQPFYQALDVFALSSIREGLPNVLLEAMALEVPVVATAIAGIPRLIEHEHNGLLVPPQDMAALSTALSQLLRDGPAASVMSRHARATVCARYDFSTRMKRELAIYDSLCGKPTA